MLFGFVWCNWCLFQGLVCSKPQLSPKGYTPVPAQSFVLPAGSMTRVYWREVTETPAVSHKGKVQWALTLEWMVESVSMQWKEQILPLGWQLSSGDSNWLITCMVSWWDWRGNSWGSFQRLPVPCHAFLLSYAFCGIPCLAKASAGKPAAHTHPGIQSWATAGKIAIVEDHDPVTGADGGRQV